jgi:hypothetical protein
VSRLRWTLVALLVASTALFAIGVIAERSDADEHAEPANAHVSEGDEGNEGEGAHEEGTDDTEEARAEGAAGESESGEEEALLGVDLESTPLVVLAVAVGFGLAGLAATRFGRLPGFLGLVALVALVWAALDVREVFHQLDESRTGIAVVAIAVAILHLAAAAVGGRLARDRTVAP